MKLRATALVMLAAVGVASCGSDTPGPASGTAGTAGAPPGGGSAGTSGTFSTSGSGGTGTAGSTAGGSGGSTAGNGGSTAGNGGSTAGNGGSTAGNGGSTAGNGGSTAGNGGSSAGNGGGGGGPNLPKRVLLYHFSTLTIASIPAQLSTLSQQLSEWGYDVKTSVDVADLSSTSLAEYGAVGMINTCFEPFGQGKMGVAETAALESFVEAGGGLFGTHCASVTFQSANPPHPYNALIGGRGGDGYFNGPSACTLMGQHPTTAQLSPSFNYVGDIDNADYVADDSTVLVKCKWSGGEQKETAVSWVRTPGKGRVFFTNFAKEDNDLKDATLGGKHILAGLGWVLWR